jgi:Holliday junction resolvase RusA-like endonuclease
MRRVAFTVPGEFGGKGSMRAYTYRRKNGGIGARATADNPKTKIWEATISKSAREAIADDPRLFTGPVRVQICAYLARPKSVSPRVRPLPTVKPDCDKLARLVLDSLTKVLLSDDAIVCSLLVRKLYAHALPYVEIVVGDYLPHHEVNHPPQEIRA